MTQQTIVMLLADGLIVPIVLLAGFALLFKIPRGHKYEAYTRIIMAGLTAYLFAKLIGAIYQPSGERPFELLGLAPGASYLNNPGFPSDHALFASFLCLAVWFEVKNKKYAYALIVMTALVCVGRVLALVHTPLDIAGGILVAGIGSLWYLTAEKRYITPKARRNSKKLVQ